MLRRCCCLCARQIEQHAVATSARSSSGPSYVLHQHQPIASTSAVPAQRLQSGASRRASRRPLSTSLAAAQDASIHLRPYELADAPSSVAASSRDSKLWKGKARAIQGDEEEDLVAEPRGELDAESDVPIPPATATGGPLPVPFSGEKATGRSNSRNTVPSKAHSVSSAGPSTRSATSMHRTMDDAVSSPKSQVQHSPAELPTASEGPDTAMALMKLCEELATNPTAVTAGQLGRQVYAIEQSAPASTALQLAGLRKLLQERTLEGAGGDGAGGAAAGAEILPMLCKELVQVALATGSYARVEAALLELFGNPRWRSKPLSADPPSSTDQAEAHNDLDGPSASSEMLNALEDIMEILAVCGQWAEVRRLTWTQRRPAADEAHRHDAEVEVGQLANAAKTIPMGDYLWWSPRVLLQFLRHISAIRRPERAPYVASLHQPLPGKLAPEAYDLLIELHLRNRNLAEARAAFRLMVAQGLEPSRSTFAHILTGYKAMRASRPLFAALADAVIASDIEKDAEVLNMVVECRGRSGDPHAALRVLRTFAATGTAKAVPVEIQSPMQSDPLFVPDVAGGESSITLQAPALKPEEHAAFQQRPPGSRPLTPAFPDGTTYSLLIRSFLAMPDPKLRRTRRLLGEAQRLGLKVDAELVARLRSSDSAWQSNLRRGPSAIDHIITEVEGLLSVDALTSFADHRPTRMLLRSHGMLGLRTVIDRMTERGIPLEQDTTSSIAYVLSHLLPPGLLAEIVEKIRTARGSSATLSDFNTLLRSFGRRDARFAHRTSLAQATSGGSSMRRIDQREPEPEQGEGMRWMPGTDESDPGRELFAFSVLGGQSPAMQHYLATMRSLYQSGIEPDTYTCAILMQRFADRGGHPATLWEYFQWQIIKRGLQPNEYHLSALMTAYNEHGDAPGAKSAMLRCEALGVKPNVHHYTILLTLAARQDRRDHIRKLEDEMIKRRITPDLHVFATLGASMVKHGAIEQLQALIQRARRTLRDEKVIPWPNSVLATLAFQCRNIRGEPLLAQESVRDDLQRGLVPDAIFLRTVQQARATYRYNRNKARMNGDEALARKLETAIELATVNIDEMKKFMRASPEPVTRHRGGEGLTATRKQVEGLLDAIIRNRDIVRERAAVSSSMATTGREGCGQDVSSRM